MKKSKTSGASLVGASFSKPMKRTDVTEMVVESRLKKGLRMHRMKCSMQLKVPRL